MDFERLYDALREILGADNVNRSDKTLVLGVNDLAVVIQAYGEEAFLIFSTVADYPETEQGERNVALRLMKDNMLFVENFGFTSAMNREMGIVVQGIVHYHTLHDMQIVRNVLMNFVKAAEEIGLTVKDVTDVPGDTMGLPVDNQYAIAV